MNKREIYSLISVLRKSDWSKFFLFLLIANFINLSANFYEGNIYQSNKVSLDDPIDTLTELIFEWVMDGGEDLIPDNGTQQDDNSLKKIKLALVEVFGFQLSPFLEVIKTVSLTHDANMNPGFFCLDTPPPDRC